MTDKTKIKITDALHVLFCDKEHGGDPKDVVIGTPNKKLCLYYAEDQLAECWTYRFHKEWFLTTTYFLKQAEVDDLDEETAYELIRHLAGIISALEDTTPKTKLASKMLKKMLTTYEPFSNDHDHGQSGGEDLSSADQTYDGLVSDNNQ